MEETTARRVFSNRHKKVLFTTLFFAIAVMCFALLPGVGYHLTVDIGQRGIIGGRGYTEQNVVFNRLFNGTVDAHFNPLLYPISYLSGSGSIFRKFTGGSDYWDHNGTQLREAVMLGTLLVELGKNIPYFVMFGIMTTLIALRLTEVPAIAKPLTELQTRLKSLRREDL